ncbi:MAG: hypothetical protein ACOYVK_11860 [Bacillota bacterium]
MFREDYNNYYYPQMPMYKGMPMMPAGNPMHPGMPIMPERPTMPMGTAQPMPLPTPQPTPMPEPTTLPPDFEYEPGAPVETDINYTQGYLKTQIGRYVKIEFLIGTNMLIDREGTLLDVGISYVIIREPETDDLLLCDIYSVKFVKIFF